MSRNKIEILDKVTATTEEEIKGYQDFDGLLDKYENKALWNAKVIKVGLIVMIVSVLMLTTYFLASRDNTATEVSEITASTTLGEEQKIDQPEIETTPKILDSVETENSTTTGDLSTTENESKRTVDTELEQTPNSSAYEKEIMVPEKEEMQEQLPKDITYTYVEAVPVEGLTYLYAYFHENLTYPNALRKDSIEGVVLIGFSVLKDSTVANVEIIQSLGEQFDNEATRVINGMPKWISATVNEVPVNSRLSIPLTFTIKK